MSEAVTSNLFQEAWRFLWAHWEEYGGWKKLSVAIGVFVGFFIYKRCGKELKRLADWCYGSNSSTTTSESAGKYDSEDLDGTSNSSTVTSESTGKYDLEDLDVIAKDLGLTVTIFKKRNHLQCSVKRSPEHNVLGADDIFLKRVQNEMLRTHHTEVVTREWAGPQGSQEPAIIICPVTSRVGSNIEHTLRGLRCEENMALLLIHPVARHVRPPRSTDESLADDRWQSLGAIVDVVYAPQEGFYNCDTNDYAVDKMCSFLRQYSTPPDEAVEPLTKTE